MPIFNSVYGGPSGWKPGSNTILYRPLEENANDQSGNNRNGTASGATFSSAGANLSSGGYIQFPAFTVPTSFTLCMWVQFGSYDCRIYSDWDGSTRNLLYNPYSSTQFQIMIGDGGTNQGWQRVSVSNMSLNTWYNLVMVKNGANVKVYNNGAYENEWTGSWSVTGGTAGRNFCLGNPSGESKTYKYGPVIMEDKIRTAGEISDYYNLTKSNYGL